MKKLTPTLFLFFLSLCIYGQSPEKMSYQAVIRDASNTLVTNQSIGMQISILQTTITGTTVYAETHTVTTNLNGLVSLEIGTGSTSDTFSTIDWSAGPYFIKTETDPTGGSSYTITGTSQLMSVPFAMYAKSSGNGITIDQSDAIVANTANRLTNTNLITALEARIVALEVLLPAAIGNLRAGGVVFWVDPSDNTHGLVCALSDDATNVVWGCSSSDLPSVPNVASNGSNPVGAGAEIGDGVSNTTGILTDCSTAPAALAARSYGAEWFLPSIKELNEIYINKATLEAVSGFTTFSSSFYWSSTELNNQGAWKQSFGSGFQNAANKRNISNVRAVRAF